MMDRRANQAWLAKEFPEGSLAFARLLALNAWWGWIWQRRNRETI